MFDGGLDGVGLLVEGEAFAQHHGGGEDLADGVGLVPAGEVVRGAVTGLIDGEAVGVEVAGERHAAGSEEEAAGVGEDVAEHVGGDDDIEVPGIFQDLIDGVVDLHDLGLEGGVGGEFGEAIAPEFADGGDAAGLQGEHESAPALFGEGDGDLEDSGDLSEGVAEGVVGGILVLLPLFAEVETADVFADHDDVHVLAGLGLDDPGVGECGEGLHGGELAEEVELLSQVINEASAARAAEDSATAGEEVLAEFDDFRGEIVPVGFGGGVTDGAAFGEVEPGVGVFGDTGEHIGGDLDDFGSDSFAGEDADGESRGGRGGSGGATDGVGEACDAGRLAGEGLQGAGVGGVHRMVAGLRAPGRVAERHGIRLLRKRKGSCHR